MLEIYQALVDSFIDANFGLSIAHKNAKFIPTKGTPYAEINVIPNDVRPFAVSDIDMEDGIFRVILRYPQGSGAIACETMAGIVMNFYKIGLRFKYGAGPYVEITGKTSGDGVPEVGWHKKVISLQYRSIIGR